jgi:hypothetical protein
VREYQWICFWDIKTLWTWSVIENPYTGILSIFLLTHGFQNERMYFEDGLEVGTLYIYTRMW